MDAHQQWVTVLQLAQQMDQVKFVQKIYDLSSVPIKNYNNLFFEGLVGFFNQGQKTGNIFWNTVRNFIARPVAEDIHCQAPKPILLATGRATFPNPWQPHIVPTQLFQIGNVFIAAVPGEFTTMSGRRLRSILKLAAGSNDTKVIVAGLSNSYSSYITTPEEYQMQRYEGASTIYGPYTLPIYLAQYEKLHKALTQQIQLDPGPLPPDFSGRLVTLVPPPLFDSAPWGHSFGLATQQPKAVVTRGEEIDVAFISSNPRNGNKLMHGRSYFTIEKEEKNQTWIAVANDADWDTRFEWKRKFLLPSHSVMHVYWNTTNAAPGMYRITIIGIARSIFGKIHEYTGETRPFQVI